MARALVWVAAAVVVLVVEAVILVLVRPAGDQLRPFVDLVSGQGIVVAVIGGLMLAGRPFPAARALLERAQARDRSRDEPRTGNDSTSGGPHRRPQRRTGAWVLLFGAALFLLATLIWRIGAAPGT